MTVPLSTLPCYHCGKALPMLCVELGWDSHPSCYPVEGSPIPVSPQHPETAQVMRKAMLRDGTLRKSIFELILYSADGLSDYDLEELLGRSHQSVSGCRNGLVRSGLVVDSGRTRRNRYGNETICWVATGSAGS